MEPFPLSARFEDTRQCSRQNHHVRPSEHAAPLSVDTTNRLFATCAGQTSGDPPSVASSGFGSGAATGGSGNDSAAKRSSGNLSLYSSASSDSLCSIDGLLPLGSSANQVPCGDSAVKRGALFPKEVRNLSLPTGTTSGTYTLPTLRRRSSPTYSRHPDVDWISEHRSGGTKRNQHHQQAHLISTGLNRLSLHTQLSSPVAAAVAPVCDGSVPEVWLPHMSPDTSGTSPSHHSHYHHHHRQSALEPIPQGQELEVVTTSSSASGRSGNTAGHWDTEMMVQSDTIEPISIPPSSSTAPSACCHCRAAPKQQPAMCSVPLDYHPISYMKRNSCPAGSRDEMLMNRNNHGGCRFSITQSNGDAPAAFPVSDQSFNSTSNSSHWARDFVGRVKGNWSAMSHHYAKHDRHQHHRSSEGDCVSFRSPDTLDPRKLPKAHGPTSASLQFSNKPLHSVQLAASVPTPALKSPTAITDKQSFKSQTNKVRWFARSGCDRVNETEHPLQQQRSTDIADGARLSCSAVENIQDAMDILAERCQPFSRTAKPARTGFRVRSASESEHLLVISKALSRTDEEQRSDCAFGRFNEKHAYNTLFRHSTCYDVLPDSGKLVMLDSRLGVLRGIRALLESGAQAAAIWRNDLQAVAGQFTQEFALHLLVCLASPHQSNEALLQTSGGPLSSALKTWGSRPVGDVVAHFCPNQDSDRQATSEHRFGCRYHRSVVVSPRLDLHTALFRLLRPHTRSSNRRLDRRQSASNTTGAEPRVVTAKATDPDNDPPGQGGGSNPVPQTYVDRLLTTHLVVTETKISGNVLGLVNADRLLAYLRVRIDDLPCPAHMSCPIGYLHGLRWSERWNCDSICYHLNSSGRRRRRWCRKGSRKTADTDNCETPPVAVLHPSTLCHEALQLLSDWLPQLPCLPVVPTGRGTASAAAATGLNSLLLGLVSPGDLLNFILNGATDTALKQPLSKLLEIRPVQCRAQQDCICFTHEPITCVLDRMFRLRTPCLVLYDLSKPPDGKSFGLPIGLVTSRDLLIATILVSPPLCHQLKTKKNRPELSTTYPFESKDLFIDNMLPTQGRRSSDSARLEKYSLSTLMNSPPLSPSISSWSSESLNSQDSSQSGSSRSSCSCPRPSRDQRRAALPPHRLASEGSSASVCCACTCHHQVLDETPEPHAKRHNVQTVSTGICSSKPTASGIRRTCPVPIEPIDEDQSVPTYTHPCQLADGELTTKSIPDTSSKRDEDDIVFRMD